MREPEEVDCPHAYECFGDSGPWGKGAFDDPLSHAAGGKPWMECHCMTAEERKELEMARLCEKCNRMHPDGDDRCPPVNELLCPICQKPCMGPPGITCSAHHGLCHVCHTPRATCKCMKSFVMDDEHGPVNLNEEKPDKLKQGLKHDGGKIDWTHMPWDSMAEVIKVYEMGAKKYKRGNYKRGILYSRLFSAAMRHMRAWWQLEDVDEESGLNHLAHACWNLLTLLEYECDKKHYLEHDDRARHEPLVQDLNEDLKDIVAGREPSTGTLKICTEGCSVPPLHECEFAWHSQWNDTAGIHVVTICTKCGARKTTDFPPPMQTWGVSIPSMWLPDGKGGVIEATVTSSVPADGKSYTIHIT